MIDVTLITCGLYACFFSHNKQSQMYIGSSATFSEAPNIPHSLIEDVSCTLGDMKKN